MSDNKALYWDAFRYLEDQLSPGERTEFESRLDVDQAARETLAEVVGHSALLRASAPLEASPSVTLAPYSVSAASWLPRAGWMSLGAAACLALVAAWNSAALRTNPPAANLAKEPLALAWNEYRNLPGVDAEPVESSDDAAEEADDDETPNWLLSAVGPAVSDDVQ